MPSPFELRSQVSGGAPFPVRLGRERIRERRRAQPATHKAIMLVIRLSQEIVYRQIGRSGLKNSIFRTSG